MCPPHPQPGVDAATLARGGIIRTASDPSGGPALDTTDPPHRPGPWSRLRGRSRPPGLRQQLGSTKDAAYRLIQAHIELARTEIPAIIDNVKAVALAASVALGFALFAATLIAIGTFLWAGEWIFGSMGWGVVHGTALSVAIIVACAGLILAETRGTILRDSILAFLIGVVLSFVFGLSLTNRGWQALTNAIAPTSIAPQWQLLVVAVVTSLVVLGVVGLVVGGVRGGGGGLVGGLVLGVILGVLVGAFTAIDFGWQVGVALGVTGGLIAFTVLQAIGIARRGVDPAAFQARFYPTQTIDTMKETLEWLKEQSPAGRG